MTYAGEGREELRDKLACALYCHCSKSTPEKWERIKTNDVWLAAVYFDRADVAMGVFFEGLA